jgi:putative transcriptional regulator
MGKSYGVKVAIAGERTRSLRRPCRREAFAPMRLVCRMNVVMKSLQGQILVASPKLVDPNFFHTVVLMVQHNDEGALGLVLNRPLQTTVRDMWAQVEEGTECEIEGPLHQGGPCEGALMVVHADGSYAEAEVTDGIYFCMRRDAIERLVENNRAAMKFFVGYAGWTAGQLDAEMNEGSWLTTPASAQMVFEGDEHLWTDLIRAIARNTVNQMVDPKRIPDDPSVN